MDALSTVIDEAEYDVFADFCQQVGVENIRELEERQLKAFEAENIARQKSTDVIVRLNTQ